MASLNALVNGSGVGSMLEVIGRCDMSPEIAGGPRGVALYPWSPAVEGL